MGTSVANRQHLPLVSVRFVPVDASTPKVPVDLRVRWTADLAPILDARRLDATQNCIKLLFRDTEAEVVDRKPLIRIYEVKRQAIVYEDRGKRSNANRGPFNPKQFGKQSRGSDFVARRNDGVIKVHCHVTPHAQDRRSGSNGPFAGPVMSAGASYHGRKEPSCRRYSSAPFPSYPFSSPRPIETYLTEPW